MTEYITDIQNVIAVAEQAKGFWDAQGLDMHIAVKQDSRLAVSTKHWMRVHYIDTGLLPSQIWEKLNEVCKAIGRKLIKSTNGPYVYINKLNVKQTQHIFDLLKKTFGTNITRVWEVSWDIDDAFLPELS